ncbi:MAG: hypothetical protein ABJF11_19555 [Reichenbachiella sp.]|uniref:hypothetical protein n=1 Tax=Reichenbachiella sp. TaxID=2184521 RepID=UPI00326535BB
MKFIKLSILLTTIAFLQSEYAIGQSDYRVGHVITNTGDTLHGRILIDNGLNKPTPLSVTFKESWTAEAQVFAASDLSFFYVENRRFTSAYVEIEISSDKLEKLSETPNFELRKNNLFLEEIIVGEKSLFRYIDKDGKSLFYFKDGNEVKLYYYKKYVDGKMTVKNVMYNNAFVQQLVGYLGIASSSTDHDLKTFINSYEQYYRQNSLTPSYTKSSTPKVEPSTTGGALELLSLNPNYQLGYIILLSGDTVRGAVDYQDWERNPEFIRFQDSWHSDKVKVFSHQEIAGFGTADVHYRSAIVDRETSSQSLSSLSRDPKFTTVKDSVFLEVLVAGRKELLHLRDRLGLNHFYITMNDEYKWLRHKMYLSLPNTDNDNSRDSDKAYMKVNAKFRGELSYYLNDCEGISDKIGKLEYNENDLTELFAKYYACANFKDDGSSNEGGNTRNSQIFVKEEEKIKPGMGLLAGYIAVTQQSGSGFLLGGYYEVFFPKNRGKFSLNNELTYYAIDYKVSRSEISSPLIYTHTQSQYDLSFIKLSSNLRYALAKGGEIEPFLGLGVSFDYNLVDKSIHAEETRFNTIFRNSIREVSSGGGFVFRSNISGGFRMGRVIFDTKYDLFDKFAYISLAVRVN